MSPAQLDERERRAFLDWRRSLVRLEENDKLVVTPFEKNLDIWRQLWRVLERSDLVVTVVDSRNPLFYHCPDMEAYVRELSPEKRTMLLLNKADLLTLDIRRRWADYLKRVGLPFIFWSAKAATDGHIVTSENHQGGDISDEVEEDEEEGDESTKIFSREELLRRLEAEAAAAAVPCLIAGAEAGSRDGQGAAATARAPRRGPVVVGFVGYPNVGKSSTINALVGQKKTGVTSTPGKTKHFQTLVVSPTLTLCDCPGLVFPSFTSSRSEMVACGVLPIDRLTDQTGPVEILCQQIPRTTLETTYGLQLPVPAMHENPDRAPTAAELLKAYARSRGYVSSSGLPDETRASRQLLKDYTAGKLLFCHLPPDSEVQPGHPPYPATVDARPSSLTAAERRGDSGSSESEWVEEAEESEDDEDEEVWEEDEEVEEEERRASNATSFGMISKTGGADGQGKACAHGVAEQESSLGSDQGTGPSSSGAGGNQEGASLPVIVDMTLAAMRKEVESRLVRGKAEHKMHKKGPRRKDRSWRVARGGLDKDDYTDAFRAVQRPASHGAALKASVLPHQHSFLSGEAGGY
eukprot:SM000220S07048  [mRNA]  locus=s220:69483:71828:- [translate_table: standard]